MKLLFVAHGSRLPAYQEDAQAFVAAWLERNPSHKVELCYLELMEPSFKAALTTVEVDTYIVPLFLHEGWHFKHDISKMISDAEKQVTTLPPLTVDKLLVEALHDRLSALVPVDGAVVIYSHGNRASEQQIHLFKLAMELQVKSGLRCLIAVAKGEPNFAAVCQTLIDSGEKKITVLPHFLFAGAWQKKLAVLEQELTAEKQVEVQVAEPLGHHPAMLQMIENEIAGQSH